MSPALLSVLTLMFLLLPCLLLTNSLQKLAVIPISLEEQGGGHRPVVNTSLRRLELHLAGDDMLLRAALRKADLGAGPDDITWNEYRIPARDGAPDLSALRARLERLHALDPEQDKVKLYADDALPSSRVVAVMDLLRGSLQEPLFPRVVLAGLPGEAPGLPREPPP